MLARRRDVEDDLRPFHGKGPAAIGCSRLNDDWAPLWAAGNVERPSRFEISTFVLDVMYLVRIGVDAIRTVELEGAGLPAIPQLEDKLHELLGTIVTLIVAEMTLQPKVERFAVIHRGHDIPGGAAIRQVIDGAKLSREMIRLVIGGGARRTEPDMPRRRCEGAKNRDRIHACGILVPVAYSDLLVIAESIGDREPVGKEDQVELSALQRARDLDIIIGRKERHRMRGIAPQRMAMCDGSRDEKSSEVHMT